MERLTKNLEGLDFELRRAESTREGEQRLQLYVASTQELAAWVYITARDTEGARVVGLSIQYVRRSTFSPTQNAAIQRWIHKIADAAMAP